MSYYTRVLKEGARLSKNGVCDATFKCSSILYPQLFIITLYMDEIMWKPVAYIHMPDKAQVMNYLLFWLNIFFNLFFKF